MRVEFILSKQVTKKQASKQADREFEGKHTEQMKQSWREKERKV